MPSGINILDTYGNVIIGNKILVTVFIPFRIMFPLIEAISCRINNYHYINVIFQNKLCHIIEFIQSQRCL